MDKIKFLDYEFLNKKDLVIGHVYVKKEGKLVLYIGKDTWNRFIFYDLASVMFESTDEFRELTLAHYDIQVHSLIDLCNTLMKNLCDVKHIVALKGMPSLYCDFGYVNYSDELNVWWDKNKADNCHLPVLEKENKKTSIYVGAKDLVPGELYYTGYLWRSLYLYLGRDNDKNFCWYFVGNDKDLIDNDINAYLMSMERTKTNKKVKRLADALKDPNATMCDEVKHLIDINWKADLTNLSLDF